MKRHSSSDSLIQICPSGSPEEKGMYGRGAFPSIMDAMEDEEECGEEELCSGGGSHHSGGGEKKRRLSTEQVRALEKNFEVENKLDPERKVRLAQDLGLQPRQVAVWFQNRRARWKTKQLERDYTALKSTYDVLRLDFDALHRDNQTLAAEIKELKAKLSGETTTTTTVKEEELVASESEIKPEDEEPPTLIYKDGFSDSDSSAVLNEDSSTTSMVNNNNSDKSAAFAWQPSFMSSESRVHKGGFGLGLGFSFQHQLMKTEEHGFLAGEEPCSSFFAEETAPTLPWCYEQWNWMDTGGENNNVGRKEGPF